MDGPHTCLLTVAKELRTLVSKRPRERKKEGTDMVIDVLSPAEAAMRWDPLVDTRQAASLLGLAHGTLAKWRAKGRKSRPLAVKLDQKVLYRICDLERWLSEQDGRPTILARRPTDFPLILDLEQAADYLSISHKSISTWRTTRPGYGPPALKMGGALRFRLSDLNSWVESRLETPR